MNKSGTRALFKAWIEEENFMKRAEFYALGSGRDAILVNKGNMQSIKLRLSELGLLQGF